MNRLKKYIYEHGEQIAKGSSRTVYRIANKVYKIPNKTIGSIQSQEEERIYNEMQDYKHLFPNPKFFGNIVQLDYLEVLETAEFDVSGFITLESNLENSKLEEVYDFLDILERKYGIIDLLPYLENVVINENFYVIDWGWTNKTENFVTRRWD